MSCHVAVVGAGIVGLTTAEHIQDFLPNVHVTVIADKFNNETTSDGAAGLFYPSSIFRGHTFSKTMEWMKYSYKYYERLIGENCGVFETSGYSLSCREEDVHNKFMLEVAPEYRLATPEELQQWSGNWKYGTFVRTLIIQCRIFLPWIMQRIQSKGGQVVKRRVQDFSELEGQYDIIVNCTGLHSKWLCADDGVVPIRGQILKVLDPSISNFFFFNGVDTYIIPTYRDGIVSLGGTCQFNVWDTEVRKHDSVGIRERCSVVPSLADAPAVGEWVGLRPHRETVRVEPEIKGHLKIVHNYGHGGYGVTSAPGTARDAAFLVQQLLQA